MHTNDNNLDKNSQQNEPVRWTFDKFSRELVLTILGGIFVAFITSIINNIMSIQLSPLISILVIAVGFLGLLITILRLFFDIKPIQKKHISVSILIFVCISSVLLFLGFSNLYAVTNSNSENHSNRGADFSPEEFVEQNSDLIRRLKAEYSNEDTQIIEDKKGIAQFCICEKGGYVFQNLMKTGEYGILCGEKIPSANVIIIDYFSDEIIDTFTSKKDGAVSYYPGNQNQFYLVAFHDEYDVYVSPPFQVVSGEADSNFSYICLEAKNSQYTPLYQFHLYMKNFGTDEPYAALNMFDGSIKESNQINLYFEFPNKSDTIE